MRPDLDAVGAVWAIKRFLPNWEDTEVRFVPAGERLARGPAGRFPRPMSSVDKLPAGTRRSSSSYPAPVTPRDEVVEKINGDEVIHVDTGLGPLDHHQTNDEATCAAKRAWEWVVRERWNASSRKAKKAAEIEAGNRLMHVICDIDHFKEVFWPDPVSDRYEITIARILDGLKLLEKDDDKKVLELGLICLDSLFRAFENKVWAEQELREKGVKFKTRFGNGIGVETYNDDVIHLSQRMGYQVAVRKDPKKGYVRIKARPKAEGKNSVDLTKAYEKLRELDPNATWFLHVSKRMLLNGTAKNPKMKPTTLTLGEIIEVLKKI